VVPSIVFPIIGIVGAAAGAIMFRRAASGSSRTLAMPATPPLASWRGGFRTKTLGGSGGTARLELFEWGARVRTSGLFGWLGLRWEVRYSELVQARLITYPIANRGVLLRTDGSAVCLAFTTFRDQEILDQLAARGVPVDRSVTPLRRTDLATSAPGSN
jgi:hypothetical protein